jgi:hypothetical protein
VGEKRKLREWEINFIFPDVWAILISWVEVVVGFDGKMNMVRC